MSTLKIKGEAKFGTKLRVCGWTIFQVSYYM